MTYPKARFYVANKSRKILESFKHRYKNQSNYKTCLIDVFKGVSIHDFIYDKSKFDLVIADKIYSNVKKKKERYSINFLYKFYIKQNGILCLVSYIHHIKKDTVNIKRLNNPILDIRIPVKNKNILVQYLLYTKNKNYLEL
jgi:hypothetical protein